MKPETLRVGEVKVGDALPELRIEITSTLVIAGAFASRDLTPVHHDKRAAQQAGLQDVIMNTMTTNGFVSRYVTDWSGPEARVRAIHLKLGAPNLPGDTMVFSGSVREIDATSGEITLDVVGKNGWGDHASGQVRVALPLAPPVTPRVGG